MRGLRIIVLIAALVVASVACSNGDDNRPAAERKTSKPSPAALSSGALRCEAGAERDCTSAGTLRWSLPLSGEYRVDDLWTDAHRTGVEPSDRPRAGAGVADGTVVYTDGLWVLAVDIDTGAVRWDEPLNAPDGLPGRLREPVPLIGEGLVCVVFRVKTPSGGDGSWAATFDLATGERVGTFAPRHAIASATSEQTLALDDGVLWFGVVGGGKGFDRVVDLSGFDARTGALRHRATFPRFDPVVYDGVLYNDDMSFGTSQDHTDDVPMRRIHRFDLRTAKPLPSLELPRALRAPGELAAATSPGILLVRTWLPQQVAALDAKTGALLWTRPTEESDERGADECDVAGVRTPDLVYLCGPDEGTVTPYDLRTGAVAGKAVADEGVRRGQIAAGRVVDWSPGRGGNVVSVSVRELSSGRKLGEVQVIGLHPALVWPAGLDAGIGATPNLAWTTKRTPVTLALGCAPGGLRVTACAEPRLFALNR